MTRKKGSERVGAGFERVPEALQALPAWLLWRHESKPGATKSLSVNSKLSIRAAANAVAEWTDGSQSD